jgi:hypothetical protein
VSADPSPVPARDDALSMVWVERDEAGWVNFSAFVTAMDRGERAAWSRVPSPDVLRAECAALDVAAKALVGPIYRARRLDGYDRHRVEAERLEALRDTLSEMLKRMQRLLASVTRDDAGDAR